MAQTSVPEPAGRWAGAVRGRAAANPAADATPNPAANAAANPAANATPNPAADPAAGTVATLFRDHHGELVRLAVLMVGDLPTAEDVVQDVYASLHRRWSQIAAPGEVLPYVRAAVLNGCRSVLRRRGRARAAYRSADAGSAGAGSAESEVILSEDRRQVLAALARLPRRRREVLVLRYYLGLSEAEIAAVLGISPGTVKSTAARGLAALARDLGEPS
jgi:RNA polymerase sigma-70 factor (sigma-E family)